VTQINEQEDGGEKKPDPKRGSGIVDYLQSPRRKRKNFVIMAYGPSIRADIPGSIDSFLRTQFPDLALTHPKTPVEMAKHFSKQINLLVYDDEFTGLSEGLELVKTLKERKRTAVMPVLFLTRRPDELVRAYNQILLPYHEADEYLYYAKEPLNRVLSKIKNGLVNRNRRRSRRYKIDIPITFFRLSADKDFPGRILDLSIHGCLIKAGTDQIFRQGDQLKLSINTGNNLAPIEGDFLKISAKVRRVYIAGNQAGVSFEHMSEKQHFLLTQYLTSLVNAQVVRKARAYKARIAHQKG